METTAADEPSCSGFAQSLVGKEVQVKYKNTESGANKDKTIIGLVKGKENSEDKGSQDYAQSWQVSVMVPEDHLEYTFFAKDFDKPSGAPYLKQLRETIEGETKEDHGPYHVLEVVNEGSSDDLLRRADKLFREERYFLGGCKAGQDLASAGLANLKQKAVSVWWPGERTWYQGVVTSVNTKNRSFVVLYTDGEIADVHYKTQVWRLQDTKPTKQNGEASLRNRMQNQDHSEPKVKSAKVSSKSTPSAASKVTFSSASATCTANCGDCEFWKDSEGAIRFIYKSDKLGKSAEAKVLSTHCVRIRVPGKGNKRKREIQVIVPETMNPPSGAACIRSNQLIFDVATSNA